MASGEGSPVRRLGRHVTSWQVVVPVLAVAAVALSWGRHPPAVVEVVVVALLAGSVLAAVHHAEVVAHRVGEPFGSLVLAVAVTIIEVSLIVTLMVVGGPGTASLARDIESAQSDPPLRRRPGMARAGVRGRAAARGRGPSGEQIRPNRAGVQANG